jgi:hypothetical protein
MPAMLCLENDAHVDLCDPPGEFSIDCDPQLVEAAVFAAVRGTRVEREYQRAREICYVAPTFEARDRAFAKLNHTWFARLSLAAPLLDAFAERPRVSARVARCIIAPAVRRQDECAELYAHSGGDLDARPYLVVRLRPESFTMPARLTSLLRHELMHIEDMLDPRFAYDTALSQFQNCNGVPTVIRDRYRVLWDIYIDVRLQSEGRIGDDPFDKRSAEFAKAFPMLRSGTARAFQAWASSTRLTHPELIEFAREPLLLAKRLALSEGAVCAG